MDTKDQITIDKLYSNQIEQFDKNENIMIEKLENKINELIEIIKNIDDEDEIKYIKKYYLVKEK